MALPNDEAKLAVGRCHTPLQITNRPVLEDAQPFQMVRAALECLGAPDSAWRGCSRCRASTNGMCPRTPSASPSPSSSSHPPHSAPPSPPLRLPPPPPHL